MIEFIVGLACIAITVFIFWFIGKIVLILFCYGRTDFIDRIFAGFSTLAGLLFMYVICMLIYLVGKLILHSI